MSPLRPLPAFRRSRVLRSLGRLFCVRPAESQLIPHVDSTFARPDLRDKRGMIEKVPLRLAGEAGFVSETPTILTLEAAASLRSQSAVHRSVDLRLSSTERWRGHATS